MEVSRLESLKQAALSRFPSLWREILHGWNDGSGSDRLWLMYSANYLLQTAGLRWAIDPVRLAHRLPGAPEMDFAADLKDLSLIVLTHRHEDHLDLELIHTLRRLEAHWVVPEVILEQVRSAGIPLKRIIVPCMLEPMNLGGLVLTPFEGLHFDPQPGSRHGVPAVGYLAEFNGKRWLFPGDTRHYDAGKLPDFGEVDGLVAHLWLGRGSARIKPPPLLDEFINFCLALQPRRIVITHLNEFGRETADLWDMHHAKLVCREFIQRCLHLRVTPALMGDRIEL